MEGKAHMKFNENHMLVQPNALINAEHNLTAHESNLVLMSLGLLNTTLVNTDRHIVTFDIADLYQITKTKLRKDRFVLAIKKAIQSLQDKKLTILNPVTHAFESHVWLPSVKGNLKTDKIELHFNTEILKLFSAIEGNYTQCLLKNIMPLKTQYAKRIYQFAMQYKPPHNIPEMPLAQFRQILQLNDSYTEYKTLNRDVINPAIKDINKQTDIILNLTPIKIGKTVNALQFAYRFKSKQAEQLVKSSLKKSVKRKTKTVNKDGRKWQQRHLSSTETPEQMNARFEHENKQKLGQ